MIYDAAPIAGLHELIVNDYEFAEGGVSRDGGIDNRGRGEIIRLICEAILNTAARGPSFSVTKMRRMG
ncbi:MAG: hypothetical protein IH898_02735 [Planctomycetes bacterium]|nr:hypothetical protein [Planctomycetota bacterium]